VIQQAPAPQQSVPGVNLPTMQQQAQPPMTVQPQAQPQRTLRQAGAPDYTFPFSKPAGSATFSIAPNPAVAPTGHVAVFVIAQDLRLNYIQIGLMAMGNGYGGDGNGKLMLFWQMGNSSGHNNDGWLGEWQYETPVSAQITNDASGYWVSMNGKKYGPMKLGAGARQFAAAESYLSNQWNYNISITGTPSLSPKVVPRAPKRQPLRPVVHASVGPQLRASAE
jgi:hypothetical protein